MRIYTAASWAHREEVRKAKRELEEAGFFVGARWVSGHDNFILPHYVYADEDLNDVQYADIVLVFTAMPSTTGGLHVETGFALALGKTIVIIGERTNLFHYMPQVQCYPTLEAFIKDKTQ